MPSVSGLGRGQRARARELATQAALLCFHHASQISYVHPSNPVGDRWEGINKQLNARRGQFPRHSDCSSFSTWCLWNALFLGFGLDDSVNGEDWTAGFTGTMRDHGQLVRHSENLRRGDCVHYGPGTGEHVTIVVGRQDGVPMVVSHGSDACPCFIRFDYRSDVAEFRRYI